MYENWMLQLFGMFKQQQKADPNIVKQRTEKREEGVNRMAGYGIKVISNWMDDRKGSNTSQTKREPGKSPILDKGQQPSQPLSKVSSTRGIKVISSRQASNERPYVTSRSNSKQKQSKEIKSQTNISEFDSAVNSKQPSFERQQLGKQFDSEGVIQAMEKRFKQAFLRQRVVYQVQIDELREVIASNEERINNLIETLNQMMEGGGRKDKGIVRLQSRINSNQKYAQQCYEYTLARCNDSQIILRHLFETIERGSIKNIEIDNKMQYIQHILVDIFTAQKKNVHQQQTALHNQIKRLNQHLHKLQQRLGEIQQLQLRHSLEDLRSANWKEHLQGLRNKLEVYGRSGGEGTDAQSGNYAWIQKEELSIKIQSLEFKLAQLETAKIQLQAQYRDREEHSQQAIRELSSLLNKQERDLQKMQKQNTSLISYNKQIENKLIQSRCRENSMQLYVQNQLKSLQNSKNSEENSRIIAQNETFREKYESLFRHNQYLQDINCRNNLELINSAKVIEDLQEKLEQAQKRAEEEIREKYKVVLLGQEIEGLKRKLGQSNRKIQQKQAQAFTKAIEIQSMIAENTTIKYQIQEYNHKIQQLQAQIQQLLAEKEPLQNELNQLHNQYLIIQKELQQQELYSEHLQKENEKLQAKIKEYTQNFEEQSQMFRSTIERLKRQREEIRYSQPKTDRPPASIKQTNPQSFSKTTIPQSNSSTVKGQQQKLLRLMKAIDAAGYKKPVPCQIDGAGYLKHLDQGTFIVDSHQNLFQLSTEEKHLAIRTNLIQLFQ